VKGVHPDKDAAGRLLECAGDCTSREMTVSQSRDLAYRTRLIGRWHLSLQRVMMKLNGMASILGTACMAACASIPPVAEPTPANKPQANPAQPTLPPAPTAPAPPTRVARGGPWSFTYAPGTYTYTIITDAVIAPMLDTVQKRQIPESSQKTTITLSATGDLQVVDPVPGPTASCDSSATLITRAQELIPKLPNQLAVGDRWRDSTTTTGCRGTIPAESTVISNYVVVGDTALANAVALQIHRTDSLSATGEGTEGQHRILVSATGTGVTDLFLDTATGRLLSSRGLQTSLVNVTTSGKLTQFIQHVTETAAIAGFR
jgi:hypothetical protein